MAKRPLIVNGEPVPIVDGEQRLLDLEEVRERIAALHRAMLDEEKAEEVVKSLKTQLARAKLKHLECQRAVRLLTGRERRIAKGQG